MKDDRHEPISDAQLSEMLRTMPRHQAGQDFVYKTMRAAKREKHGFGLRFFVFATSALSVFCVLFFMRPGDTTASSIASPHNPAAAVAGAPSPAVTTPVNDAAFVPAELEEVVLALQRLEALSRSQGPMIRVKPNARQEYYIDVSSFAEATRKKAYAHYRPTRQF